MHTSRLMKTESPDKKNIFVGPRAFYTRDEHGSLRRLTMKNGSRPTVRTLLRDVRRVAFAEALALTPYLTASVPA